jgi:hypothetical protein
MSGATWVAQDGEAGARISGDPVWRGTVDGGVVRSVLPVPDSDDAIAFLDSEQRPAGVERWHPFNNILRITTSGDVSWWAQLVPQETAFKAYFQVMWRDGHLVVMTGAAADSRSR